MSTKSRRSIKYHSKKQKKSRKLKTCERKLKHETLQHALIARKALMISNPIIGYSAYKCSQCGKYHVGRNGRINFDKLIPKSQQITVQEAPQLD